MNQRSKRPRDRVARLKTVRERLDRRRSKRRRHKALESSRPLLLELGVPDEKVGMVQGPLWMVAVDTAEAIESMAADPAESDHTHPEKIIPPLLKKMESVLSELQPALSRELDPSARELIKKARGILTGRIEYPRLTPGKARLKFTNIALALISPYCENVKVSRHVDVDTGQMAPFPALVKVFLEAAEGGTLNLAALHEAMTQRKVKK